MNVALSARVLNDGDAIGNDLLGMAGTLRSIGHEVTLFAEKSRVDADIRPLAELSDFLDSPEAVLIHHHSNDCETAVRAIVRNPTRAVVKHHNATPAHYFAEFAPSLVAETDRGRRQAVQLARHGITFWVDSAFNGEDLRTEVPDFRYTVLPPFTQADQLARTVPDIQRLSGVDDWATTLLCVGRVAPNKNLELAIDTLAHLLPFRRDARLIIAGEHLFPSYSERLLAHAANTGVEDRMHVTGRVSTGQLHALYRSSDVLLSTSEHEGFCVPLVEAMALGIPIVALPRTAVPDTAGDAALTAEDAAGLADAVHQIVSDGPLREARIRRGFARYRERYSSNAIAARFRALAASAFTSSSARLSVA